MLVKWPVASLLLICLIHVIISKLNHFETVDWMPYAAYLICPSVKAAITLNLHRVHIIGSGCIESNILAGQPGPANTQPVWAEPLLSNGPC